MIDRAKTVEIFRGEYAKFTKAIEKNGKDRRTGTHVIDGASVVDGRDITIYMRIEIEDLASKLGISDEELRRGIDL